MFVHLCADHLAGLAYSTQNMGGATADMVRHNRVMNMEPSGCTVVGEMTAEVCLSNKRRKVIASSGVVLLPDEIITEVLLRLPIKSILRFRAVCRSWAALLSSEEFCSLHMAMAEVKPSLPKLLFVSPTENFDSTAVYSCSLLDHKDDLLFTLDYARGNFVDVVPAPCHGLPLCTMLLCQHTMSAMQPHGQSHGCHLATTCHMPLLGLDLMH